MQDIRTTVEDYLLRKQKQIEAEIASLEKEDPVLLETVDESPELGMDAWRADVHAKSVVLKNNLLNLSSKIKQSLIKLKKGTYGQCERCGKEIESERLKIVPTASACAVCISLVRHF